MKLKIYHTEEQYFNEKLHEFINSFHSQNDRDTVAKVMSFILNNYPETKLFLRGDKVAEDHKQIGEM
jgi:hypothetical protein